MPPLSPLSAHLRHTPVPIVTMGPLGDRSSSDNVPNTLQDQVVDLAVLRRGDLAEATPEVARQVDAGVDAILIASLQDRL